MTWEILTGDCRDLLQQLPAQSVHTVVTSPPFFGLRDYGTGEWEGGDDPACDHLMTPHARSSSTLRNDGREHTGPYDGEKAASTGTPYRDLCAKCGGRRMDRQIGLEPTPDEFVTALVEVFRSVRRVLRDDGTVWLNLGDSYASSPRGNAPGDTGKSGLTNPDRQDGVDRGGMDKTRLPGVKQKDLIGIPWAVAQALRAPYYAGDIKAERDRVWLAATLDAEGSICGFTHVRKDDGSTRTGVHVTITNTVEALLNEADRIWPASRVEHENHGEGHYGSRPSWRWVAHGAERKALLMRELYPYMIAKREQARLAYRFFELSVDAKRLGHSPQRDATREKRAWLVDALSRLNRGEDVDTPSWVGEPPTVEEPGWYLRSDIIWHKPNPMPESVTDRPTRAHEFIFLLTKSARYHYDADAIRESDGGRPSGNGFVREHRVTYQNADGTARGVEEEWTPGGGRNKRDVWTVSTKPYAGAHFATFPPDLIEPCVLAGCPERACGACGAPWTRVAEREDMRMPDGSCACGTTHGNTRLKVTDDSHMRNDYGDGRERLYCKRTVTTGFESSCECNTDHAPGTVLDPFAGAGTTGIVAIRNRRSFIGLELNPEYAQMARDRINTDIRLGHRAPQRVDVDPEQLGMFG